MWFSSSDRFQVLTWLEKYLPYTPDDFADSWRDGRLMAILLNKLHPGCYPDAYKLDPDYGLKNVYKVFDVLEMYFGIKPNVSPEEIVTCSEGSDVKLFEILLQLKCMNDTQEVNVQHVLEPDVKEESEPCSNSQSCIVMGTGLAIGFVGKCSNFILYCAAMSELDVVIEIRGPTTICSEKITKRSPKKKQLLTHWEYPRCLTRSVSCGPEDLGVPPEVSDLENRLIPLEYEIIGNQICLCYKPKEKGKHRLAVLWHGQHVSDSPYYVDVEDTLAIKEAGKAVPLKSALRSSENSERNECKEFSVRFQRSTASCRDKHFGRIRSKRVLGYIVKINGKDVPVNAQCMEELATELLKMDYDFEECSTFHRRNSWGFTGDAERKKSAIRQFGIDVNVLEAQVTQRRTRSLSISPGRKRLSERSDSFESLPSVLKIVPEDVLECPRTNHNFDSQKEAMEYFRKNHSEKFKEADCDCSRNLNVGETEDGIKDCPGNENTEVLGNNHYRENEEKYAFINEDIDVNYENDKGSSDVSLLEPEEDSKTLKFSNNLSLNTSNINYVERSVDKLDSLEISTLTTGFSPEIKVDNLYEDLPTNISPYTENLKEINIENEDNAARSYLENHLPNADPDQKEVECTKFEYEYLEFLNSPKQRNRCKSDSLEIQKYVHLFLNKRSQKKLKGLAKTKTRNSNKLYNKYKEVSKSNCTSKQNKDPKISPSPNYAKKEILDSKDLRLFERSELCSQFSESNQKIIHTPKSSHSQPSNNFAVKAKDLESEKSKIKQISNSDSYVNNTTDIHAKEGELLQQTTEIGSCNIDHPTKTLGNLVNNCRDDCPKHIKTHSLKPLKQFDFKQFKPSIELQSTSPVKSQIKLWESSLSVKRQDEVQKISNISETSEVNVKEKLAFWESTSKSELTSSKETFPKDITDENEAEISRRFDLDETSDVEDTGTDMQEKNV